MSYLTQVLADSPALLLRLGDPSGTTANDSTTNNRDGTITGTPTLGVAGPCDDGTTAITFDGVDDLVDITDGADVDATGDFSVECWFKTGTLVDPNVKLFWKRTGGNGYGLHLTTATGLLTFECETGSVNNQLNTTVTSYADGQWHHVVATRSGANGAIYVDGALVAGPTSLTANSLANTAVLRLGSNDAVTRRLVGTAANFAFYNSALTLARIAAHYAARVTTAAVMTVARLGVARLGAFRLNGFLQDGAVLPGAAWVKVLINGVDRSSKTFVDGVTITDELNHAPNSASFRVRGFTPVVGQEVKIYLADTDLAHQLFGGHILSLDQGFEGKPAAPNVYWSCSCIDYTWLLNRRPVIKKYTSQSATAIILDLIASFTSGITTVNVTAGLASLDEITFTNEEVTDALTRITERIGGYWYLDYAKDLHVFLTEAETAHDVTQTSVSASSVKQDADLSQVANRVTVRGGGSNTASDVAVGQTTLPVEDLSWYASSGGVVEVGPQRVTYTGIAAASETGSTTGFVAPPPIGVFYAAGGGTLTASSTYLVAWSYVTAEGEALGPTQAVVLGAGQTQIQTDSAPMPTDPKITVKAIYLSTSNGAQATMKKYTDYSIDTDGSPTIVLNSPAAGINVPTTNTAGTSLVATAAGSTTLFVEDLAQFAASGWAEVGGVVFSYTGRSGSSGAGTLTGIPASGVGSLTAAVRAGTVRSIPHLTGVTGVAYAIPKGEPVNIVVTVNDTAAQTAMAAAVGGDGIHEMFLSDGRWSITEATARANAELSQRKDPLITTSLRSRDQTIQSGRSITFSMTNPAITGTAKIQRVTISEIGIFDPPRTLPLRTVECSSRMYSLEDLLRLIRKAA